MPLLHASLVFRALTWLSIIHSRQKSLWMILL